METIAITLTTQVEAEGFSRPETLLFMRSSETLVGFEQRIFQSLLSHRIVQEVALDQYYFGLKLHISVVGSFDQKWMLDVRRFFKKSFKLHRVPLTDNWVY